MKSSLAMILYFGRLAVLLRLFVSTIFSLDEIRDIDLRQFYVYFLPYRPVVYKKIDSLLSVVRMGRKSRSPKRLDVPPVGPQPHSLLMFHFAVRTSVFLSGV